MIQLKRTAFFITLLSLVVFAPAQNLIQNGDFSSGYYGTPGTRFTSSSLYPNDWGFSPSNLTSQTYGITQVVRTSPYFSYNYISFEAYGNTTNLIEANYDSLQQTVATSFGRSYLLSYDVSAFSGANLGGTSNAYNFNVTWNGNIVAGTSFEGAGQKHDATLNFLVVGTGSDTIAFNGFGGYQASSNLGGVNLSFVSLTAQPVPEKSNFYPMIAGLVGTVCYLKRRIR